VWSGHEISLPCGANDCKSRKPESPWTGAVLI
jgi:hypothetical protein